LSGFRGVVEFRCSGDIAVTHVIGPGEQPHGDGVLERQFRNDISTTVQVPSVEDSQSFAIMMELQENLTDDLDHVYFQFAAHYSTLYQAQVTRVVTVRLPTTTSVSTYLQSVDDEVAAVLIAKKTVLKAKSVRDLADMRASVDERLKDIAQKFGNTLPKSKLRSFPASLAKLPELLFHLRRGPLLGSIIGHEDERAVYRSLYLQAGFDLSLRMMAPRLLMHRGAGTFEELPAHDLALQSNAVIVLDHGTDFFIWTGLDIAADEAQSAGSQAACLTLAHELTEQRFPAPRLLAFKEGSSQARYLKARLIPAHKDPPYEQDARFPQLRSLSVEQRARLKNSFVQTDESSFCEWMRSLKLVPP
jgi:protein transport protein SEC23